ncbi:SAM domain-containing protein 1 [Elsinoe australis]|uniref:SAM domain-containing protein 1 n=1 Tax=Elsinoe australis TaxID=40998 RepID=A0A4U7B3B4_9PEZI|nr:SAM domain-containing protein 1 [Elsinoe australis]
MVLSVDFARALESLGLEQYHEILRNEGFETWDQLRDITEEDMVALGIKLGHRRRLQRAINDSRPRSDDDALTQAGLGRPAETSYYAKSASTSTMAPSIRDDHDPSSERPPQTKRKYRRHPKPDENAPERPPSAYVIFSNRIRERLRGQELSFTDIAKIVGENWQDPDPEERAACERQAQAMKETYYAQLTEYKKTPQWAAYQEYLADFKEKHGDANSKKSKRSEAGQEFSDTTRSNSGEQLVDGLANQNDQMLDNFSPTFTNTSLSAFTPSSQRSYMDSTVHERSPELPPSMIPQHEFDAHIAPTSGFYRDKDKRSFSYDRPRQGAFQGWSSEPSPIWREPSSGDVRERQWGLDHLTSSQVASQDSRRSALFDTAASRYGRPATDIGQYSRRSSSSTASPIDPRNRTLPPPAGLASTRGNPDSFPSLRPQQRALPILTSPTEQIDSPSSLALPPIRCLPEHQPGDQR